MRRKRQRRSRPGIYVQRLDGQQVRLWPLRGQLFVCAYGCCCGHEEKGHPPVPVDLYHQEWERRGLARFVHLTFTQCLGACALANVALLVIDGQAYAFQGMTAEVVPVLFDFIEAWVAQGAPAPLPPPLAERAFHPYTWAEDAVAHPPACETTQGEGQG